jgi:hypothetical protein
MWFRWFSPILFSPISLLMKNPTDWHWHNLKARVIPQDLVQIMTSVNCYDGLIPRKELLKE